MNQIHLFKKLTTTETFKLSFHHQQQPPHQSFSHTSNQLNQLNQPAPSQHHQISGDPLFSSLSSDPYTDLFALEDTDMKLPTGLGNTLSWDRLDFTA